MKLSPVAHFISEFTEVIKMFPGELRGWLVRGWGESDKQLVGGLV